MMTHCAMALARVGVGIIYIWIYLLDEINIKKRI